MGEYGLVAYILSEADHCSPDWARFMASGFLAVKALFAFNFH